MALRSAFHARANTSSAAPSVRDEAKIIASIIEGDTSAFHDLIRPYESLVYRVAVRFLRNDVDAEDVVQDAFLKAFRNLAAFRADARFSTWLISITLNEAKRRFRKGRDALSSPLASTNLTQPLEDRVPDHRQNPLAAVERNELRRLIQRALTKLPPAYRHIYVLRDIQEFSTIRAAKVLGISIPTAKTRLHRARSMLRAHLHFISPSTMNLRGQCDPPGSGRAICSECGE
jgi:RNA polymerase sigma-70 factor, ECF subfamily